MENPAYAALSKRALAMMIDLATISMMSLAATPLLWLIFKALEIANWRFLDRNWQSLDGGEQLVVDLVFLVHTGALYFPLCESSPARATVGKRTMGLQVCDYSGRRLSFPRAFWRWLAKLVLNLGGWLSPVSAVMVAITSRNQGLHDYFSRTVVIASPATEVGIGLARITMFAGLPPVLLLSSLLWLTGTP